MEIAKTVTFRIVVSTRFGLQETDAALKTQ